MRYLAGTNSAVWDGLDDNSNPVAAGVYQIKVLQHNTEYVGDGAIGNISAVFAINESPGCSHVFQFLFRGDVTLWAGGTNAILQALFLDDAPVTFVTGTNTTLTTPLVLTNATIAGDGTFQFSFSNSQAASFTVLSTTNLSLPLSDWTVLGPPSNTAPGLFQFTAQTPTNNQQRYYLIRSP